MLDFDYRGMALVTHRGLIKRTWLLAVLVAVLIVGHGVILYWVSSHKALTVMLGLVVLLLLKHVGVFGTIYAILRRRSRHEV